MNITLLLKLAAPIAYTSQQVGIRLVNLTSIKTNRVARIRTQVHWLTMKHDLLFLSKDSTKLTLN
ncbi:hypothetical protein HanXRQr2_Chr17g0824801 [Helianthus annuus]|uniref:Uncharacterized protein n=1 Tax=Helianthus annuus TaxID=4232 RepID=A0A9K3GWZ1_HELAN|nr:hypothetical protein HanXRQr2_Chr17g0824801 [Helianthus annuus]